MIEITDCSKIYRSRDGRREVKALDGVNLVVKDKEFVALLGQAAAAKPPCSKFVAGLIPWNGGGVTVANKPVTGPGPERAVVFQNFALMPWASIKTNVAFGLELQGVSKEEREKTAEALIEAVGLKGFEDRYPPSLRWYAAGVGGTGSSGESRNLVDG